MIDCMGSWPPQTPESFRSAIIAVTTTRAEQLTKGQPSLVALTMQIRELVANGIAEILNQEQIIPPIEVPKESIAKIREQVLRLNRSTIPDHILVEYLKTLRDQRLIQCTIPHPGTDQGRHRELPFS